MKFVSLQAAKNFINQEAEAHVYHLHCLGSNIGKVPFVWCNNQAVLDSIFTDHGYSLSDSHAIQALNDAMQAGYIQPNGIGGVMITQSGYDNIGKW